MENFNTLALAYTNEKGEVVAWSSDSFGTPSKYPKTYKDTEDTREMLNKRYETNRKFLEKTSKVVGKHNSFAGALMEAGARGNEEFFTKHGVVGTKLFALDLLTDYKNGFPEWNEVKRVVDEKNYKELIT